jgi:hypothetical protein
VESELHGLGAITRRDAKDHDTFDWHDDAKAGNKSSAKEPALEVEK